MLTSFHSLLPETCTKRTTTAERGAEPGCRAMPCLCHAMPLPGSATHLGQTWRRCPCPAGSWGKSQV